jgi:hypothetical protein
VVPLARDKNLLEMKPVRKPSINWIQNEGIIVLKIMRNGIIDKLIHKIFKTPQVISVELDEIGSFVWEKCDGTRNLNEISGDLKDYFGDRINPALERLVEYIKMLKGNSLIELE